jgi:hypothetical protein
VTHRDTLTSPVPPDDCQGDDLTLAGIAAAVQYLESEDDPEPPPSTPWLAMLTIVLLAALLVVAIARGMSWLQATTLGVVLCAAASMAWGGVVAEVGREMGDGVVR